MKLTLSFVKEIRELICRARTTVARGVDLVQVHTNFEIGRRIVEQEQKGKHRAAYGKEVIKALAERLTGEFGNGFSRAILNICAVSIWPMKTADFNCPDSVWAIAH